MELIKEFECHCGKLHKASVGDIVTGKGAINALPSLMEKISAKKAFMVADRNTYAAAGKAVAEVLNSAAIPYTLFVFEGDSPEPDEKAVGSVVMHFDSSCDAVIGVGSGVINDICKIVSKITNKPYMIVATAPSMDGYASASSSMIRDGFKISLPSKCADAVIGDTDILKTAPVKMLKSGLGDMLAKYVSICEWRISNLINGEYYCEEIAGLIRTAVKKCVDNASGLLNKDDAAVEAVFEGLVLSGVAMNYADMSRPASGVEHYFSHIWDMRGLEFGTPVELHGIQCAIGTNYALKIYEKLQKIVPDREKALSYVVSFDYDEYSDRLRAFLGKGADAMISLEKNEGKYDKAKHRERLEKIISDWDKIISIADEELISSAELEHILDTIDAPKTCREARLDESIVKETFLATKDIRDKYVLSRLCFDLGIIDEVI